MASMTVKQRWLAAVDGEPVDRLPFWPKLNRCYAQWQTEPFRHMTNYQIHEWIGSDKHEWSARPVRAVRRNSELIEVETATERITTFRTPIGELQRRDLWDEPSQSFHPHAFPVKTPEDLAIMTAFYADEDWEIDPDVAAQERARSAELGSDAVLSTSIGQSPFMRWVQWDGGMVNAHLWLLDHRREIEAMFAVHEASLLKKTTLIAEQGIADLYYYTENTSTTLHSPRQHQTYTIPFMDKVGELLASYGRRFVFHMCGSLLDLLPILADAPAVAFEAFTSPPLGNTRLLDGKTHCPEKCLIGGTNATLWTKPAHEIIAEMQRDLDPLPDHRRIVMTSGGAMTPLATPETIREVCQWVHSYPVQV